MAKRDKSPAAKAAGAPSPDPVASAPDLQTLTGGTAGEAGLSADRPASGGTDADLPDPANAVRRPVVARVGRTEAIRHRNITFVGRAG
ncbi:hypothetical protein [Magnetospirillum sp. UT-4]|uniref:hypothetical protein n=1 Tax=Magnetospirillum sp. UT-4 TaxID=2681467 RepID=UPI0013862DF4|nr:hypothetical protein [Magnetospirillum sp. UT-4]CAA7621181.1 hypothetical protein MTBUT4_380034 [Magnetospirillum sp. UT-4]